MKSKYMNPKLLFEFYKRETVPPLATKYDFETESENTIKNHKKYMEVTSVSPSIVSKEYESKIDNKDLKIEVEKEQEENRELRMIVNELEEKLEKLMIVNDSLIERIEELENREKVLSEMADATKREVSRKVRVEVYNEIESYLKLSIQNFTSSMSQTKMSPIAEHKMEEFLEEILNINNISVRKTIETKNQQKNKHFNGQEVNQTIEDIVLNHSVCKSREKSRERDQSLTSNKYSNVLDKLSRINEELKPGRIVPNESSSRMHSSFQTSTKRTKIFNRVSENRQTERSSSREMNRKLDF